VTRRTKKEAPDKGGWGAFFTSWGATDVLNPVSAAYLNASCDKATFGWPCDETLEKLRDAYASESDPAKQKAIAEQVQLRVLEYPTFAPLGQFTTPTAIRANIDGLLSTPSLALWNVEKK
jgi:peptide/nickel transport system substrate-binding protein